MQRSKMFAISAVGLAEAIAVPTIAFGNARREEGTQSAFREASTPLVSRLIGANEFPGPGDTDGVGGVALTFDAVTVTDTEVCFDLSYSGIDTPTAAHIHPGAAGTANPPVVDFGLPGPTAHTGCQVILTTLADQIVADPESFYVNVHNLAFPGGAIRGQLSAGPIPAGEAHMLPVPLRAYDSRDNAGAKIAPNETRTISLAAGKDGAGVTTIAVPPGATAAIVTLTVTETGTGVGGAGGFLTMYNADLTTQPTTSNINWSGPNENVAVSTQVAVSAGGSVKVAAGANSTHFVIDVTGYLF